MQDKLNSSQKIFSENEIAVYAHVPFCSRPCAYCKFYKQKPTLSDIENYLDALEVEVKAFFKNYPSYSVKSIFFGGGTPSSLSNKQLEKLCKIFEFFSPPDEWTIEASPATINKEKLQILKNFGVNRISLGVQSFDENTLLSLGRSHSAAANLKALDIVFDDFSNVNIDLIFGAQNQTKKMWLSDLQKALSYPITHLSAYCLEFESGSGCCAGLEKDIDEQEKEVDFLYATHEILSNKGFKHYEISNYAKANYECSQNLNTWNMGKWIGFGPSAASQINGYRFRNPADLKVWQTKVRSNSDNFEDIVPLDDNELYCSALIFGLRMLDGVNLQALKQRFPSADFKKYQSAIQNLKSENLLEQNGDILKIPLNAIALADSIALELL